VQDDEKVDWKDGSHVDVRAVAKDTLLQILEPLAGFVSDLGFSAVELQSIFREAAVKCAAGRQLEDFDRINISGIAATTGITRSEISRILKAATLATKRAKTSNDGQQQSTSRILAAWHEDPKFAGVDGQPADLQLYGRGMTFEALTKRYGRGIPTRAVFDELIRVGAIELLPTQKVRVKSYFTVERGMSPRVIKAFGVRASELLSTMLLNMRKPEAPKFVANVSATGISSSLLPLLRKELSGKGADFLVDVQESFSRKPRARTPKRPNEESTRVSVTVFYHESSAPKITKIGAVSRRRNFRREA